MTVQSGLGRWAFPLHRLQIDWNLFQRLVPKHFVIILTKSVIGENLQKLSKSCTLLHYVLLAYFCIRYHRLEVAKKWISKAVLFWQVFRRSLAVLLPHCILEILESFWVPQSLWLESWKFSFVFVLVRKGWALSRSSVKEKLDMDFQIAWFEFT